MTGIMIVLAIGLGYVIGLLQNGIHIYKDQKTKVQDKQDYNSSYLEEVPSDMRLFVEQHQGQYK